MRDVGRFPGFRVLRSGSYIGVGDARLRVDLGGSSNRCHFLEVGSSGPSPTPAVRGIFERAVPSVPDADIVRDAFEKYVRRVEVTYPDGTVEEKSFSVGYEDRPNGRYVVVDFGRGVKWNISDLGWDELLRAASNRFVQEFYSRDDVLVSVGRFWTYATLFPKGVDTWEDYAREVFKKTLVAYLIEKAMPFWWWDYLRDGDVLYPKDEACLLEGKYMVCNRRDGTKVRILFDI